MANVVITISGNDTDRYKLLTTTKILGRQYDNAAENIVIVRPSAETDSVCVMVVKDKFGNLIDRVIFDDTNTYAVLSNVSQYSKVLIGFSFTRNDGYIKNSEVMEFKFEPANKPTDFIPVPPEQEQNVTYLLDHGFTGVTESNNRLTFTGSNGQTLAVIDLSDFVEAQADFAETDTSAPAYVKNKKTSLLENDGDGSNPFITKSADDLTNYYTKSEADISLGNKVDKVEGKGLSENDLTDSLKSGYDNAATNAHTHSNKATLDSVTAAFTTELKTAYDGAVTDKHAHSNKAILDATDTAFTSTLKNTYDAKQNALSTAQQNAVDSGITSTLVGQIGTNQTNIGTINAKIPAQASSENQLADKSFVNSSISTATATFRGTYNIVTDLGLSVLATEQEITAAIAAAMVSQSITPTKNDYVFVAYPDAIISTQYTKYDRYKYNGTAWEYEFTLNNSSFTADQWAAINSGITDTLVSQIGTNASNISSLNTSKQNTIDNTHKLSSDLVDDTSATNLFVTSSEKSTWSGKQSALTTSSVSDGTVDKAIGFDSQGNLIKGAISGGDGGFYMCTYGTTTYAQIGGAINSGLIPVCIYNGGYLYVFGKMEGTPSDTYVFFNNSDGVDKKISVNSSDAWSNSSQNMMKNPMSTKGAVVFSNDASGTPASLAIGTSGQVLSVGSSGTPEWTTPSSGGMTNPMTTEGDIIYGGSSGTPTRLAKGTAGQVLKMNSGATAPEWANESGGGADSNIINIGDSLRSLYVNKNIGNSRLNAALAELAAYGEQSVDCYTQAYTLANNDIYCKYSLLRGTVYANNSSETTSRLVDILDISKLGTAMGVSGCVGYLICHDTTSGVPKPIYMSDWNEYNAALVAGAAQMGFNLGLTGAGWYTDYIDVPVDYFGTSASATYAASVTITSKDSDNVQLNVGSFALLDELLTKTPSTFEGKFVTKDYVDSVKPASIQYLTVAPSANNTDGGLKFVVLSSEPANYYTGYYYIITES